MNINEFKAWLEGYQHSFRRFGPNATQWAEIAAKIDRLADDEDRPPQGVGGIDRSKLPFWQNHFAPKSDPTAVPSTDDVVEELKQQYQKTTFHHPV